MRLGRNVVVLGVVSLLADVSGDMVMPILPAFLVTLGAGAGYIGVIEGAAEGTAALLKYVSGRWADRVKNLVPLAMIGYVLAATARPFLAIAQKPWHVLAVRNLDRVGKGIRTSPRDKLLASSTAPERLAEAFSFHRGMDHAGAAVGPLLASGMLLLWPGELRRVFLVAAVPGALAVLALFAIREDRPERAVGTAPSQPSPPGGAVPVRLLAAVGLFTLGNSTDALLLLRAGALGIRTALLPLLWALLHVMRATLSWPAGRLADRLGRRGMLICGWLWYAACYLCFSLARSPWQVWMLFAAYGLVAALSEGTERALIAAASPPGSRGRALGLYNLVSGVGLLAASVLAGQVWEHVSAAAALQLGAALAFLAAAVLGAGRQAPAA